MDAKNPNKPKVSITIQGKEFDINFVSNYVVNIWNDLSGKMADVIALSEEMTGTADKVKEGAMTIEAARTRAAEISKKIKEIGGKEFFDARMDIIKEIVETNGYEFDEKWWTKRTEPSDLVHFISASINKDLKKN